MASWNILNRHVLSVSCEPEQKQAKARPDKNRKLATKGRLRVEQEEEEKSAFLLEWKGNNVNVNAHITHLFIYYIWGYIWGICGRAGKRIKTKENEIFGEFINAVEQSGKRIFVNISALKGSPLPHNSQKQFPVNKL